MKEQITRTKFTCDYCKRVTGELLDFPYNEGWMFLYMLSFKTNKRDRERYLKDKHFCSRMCFIEFISNMISKGDLKNEP